MSKEAETEFTLEENFARLEELVNRLSDEDISLEQAFTAYSQGMEVLKQCNEQIDRVEKKVLKLSEGNVLTQLQ
ncbi:MAG: exodeoxyribonuclease VII small subunit [Lachnospiraceae bacterium]|nr:exodeoxyribonuclease VII small subunit [Lachnospiraceae bacterium]